MPIDQGEKSLETLNVITYHDRVFSYVHKRSLSVIVIWLDSLKIVLNLRHFVIPLVTQQFVTVPAIPHPAHWRAYSVTCEQRKELKIISLNPSEDELSLP